MTPRNKTSGPPMSLANMRQNGVRAVIATCESCNRSADVNVDAMPETVYVPKVGQRLRCSQCGSRRWRPDPHGTPPATHGAVQKFSRMKTHDEQLTWAKQRALICVGVGRFSDAVAGLRADLGKGAISSERQCADTKRRATRRSAGVRKR